MSDTVFKQVNYDLSSLMKFVELGEIGLPDIQRPFVWKNAKVRDLFDSIYRGYPVGYLLLWQNAFDEDAKSIGVDSKQKPPKLLIVDGQQRLTSLYAVIRGIPVIRETYEQETIEIAFNPLLERFEVADAAIRRDKAYVPNISSVWSADTDLFELVDGYLGGLGGSRDLSAEEIRTIRRAFTRLNGLLNFPFTALELAAHIDEEQVAEVFVRVNSKGKPLNQADFILTLMSVFWDAGRTQLEEFCRQAKQSSGGSISSFNHFIEPSPDQLLRVCVGIGFRRARLQYVYSILRGKDLDTGDFSAERRDSQFDILKRAQARVLRLQYWHDFFKAVLRAGFRYSRMISSQSNLLFAYILYLMGRTEYGVDEFLLRRLIAQWFFMTALTGRYTSSPESKMEFDLARFRTLKNADDFATVLEDICASTLTSDFWSIGLPNDLATSSARSPAMFAFFAALNLHDARVLFSRHKVSELMDPSTGAVRKPLERHHLFPKEYLKSIGVDDLRDVNQIANFTMVEWTDNAKIGKDAPSDYLPVLKERFDGDELERMYYWHGLPDNWEVLEYRDFLRRRRELMAKVIKDAYSSLTGDDGKRRRTVSMSMDELVHGGETATVEFKSTLRKNLHTGHVDPRMELGVLKTVAAFVNSGGGTLIVGVADDGDPVGIGADSFANEDKMSLHLTNLLVDRIGPQTAMYVHPRFDNYEGERVMVIECLPGKAPLFVKDGNVERFYVRFGPGTRELTASQGQDYVGQRFG